MAIFSVYGIKERVDEGNWVAAWQVVGEFCGIGAI